MVRRSRYGMICEMSSGGRAERVPRLWKGAWGVVRWMRMREMAGLVERSWIVVTGSIAIFLSNELVLSCVRGIRNQLCIADLKALATTSLLLTMWRLRAG